MRNTLKWIGALSLAFLLLVWSCKKTEDPAPPTPSATDDKAKYPNEQRGSNFLSSAEYEAISQIPTPAIKGGRVAAGGRAATLPDSVDLSAEMPPIGNQGAQGSCVGWATTYAVRSYLEHYTKKTTYLNGTTPNNDVLFSPAFVYNQLNGGQDNGLYVRDALDLLKTQGSTTLSDMPYQSTDYITQPTDKQKTKAAGFKLKTWGRVSKSMDEMKAFLANKNPIIIAVNIDANMTNLVDKFGTEVGWKTYDPNTVRGGHAMVIVGYSNTKKAFKVQNSWGSNWGNKGFFWMSYDLLSYIREAYTATVEGKEIQVDLPPAGKSSSNFIAGFTFKEYGPDKATAGGDISVTLHTVSVTVVAGTDVTKLVPTILLPDFATVSPASGVAQDFSKPVVYTVTAEDGTKQAYTVTVVVSGSTAFLADYSVQPTVETPDPTTIRIKKAMTIKSAPTAAAGSAYWYGYYNPDPSNNKAVYLGMVKEATNFSFDVEVKSLTPNKKYTIQPFFLRTNCDDAAGPEGPTCTKARNGAGYALLPPTNNDDTKNRISVKTADYPDNSDNTISSYKNVRLVISKGTAAAGDSCLLDLKNGKVYPLKDGAKNAASIDLIFAKSTDFYNLIFYSPTDTNNPIYSTIQTQAWSTYRKTYVSIGNEGLPTSTGYPYTWVGGWHNINTATDFDKFSANNPYSNDGGIGSYSSSGGSLKNGGNSLLGFKTADGKKGVARLNELTVTATGIVLVMDIKVAK